MSWQLFFALVHNSISLGPQVNAFWMVVIVNEMWSITELLGCFSRISKWACYFIILDSWTENIFNSQTHTKFSCTHILDFPTLLKNFIIIFITFLNHILIMCLLMVLEKSLPRQCKFISFLDWCSAIMIIISNLIYLSIITCSWSLRHKLGMLSLIS